MIKKEFFCKKKKNTKRLGFYMYIHSGSDCEGVLYVVANRKRGILRLNTV